MNTIKLVVLFSFLCFYGSLRSQTYSWVNTCKETDYGKKCVTVDALGNVYFSGTIASASMVFGSTTLTNISSMQSSNKHDIFIVKCDPNGSVLWAKTLGGTGDEIVTDLKTDANNNLFLGGAFTSSVATAGTVSVTKSTGNFDYNGMLFKFDSNGNALWGRQVGSAISETVVAIAVNTLNNVYILGNYLATFSAGTTTLSTTSGNIFLIGYDSNGNLLNAFSYGTPNVTNQTVTDLCSDGSNNLIVTGGFNTSSVVIGSTTLTNNNSTLFQPSALIFKVNSLGAVSWAKTFANFGNGTGGSGKGNLPTTVTSDSQGNIVMAGRFWGDFGGYLTVGTTTLAINNSLSNMFVVKIDPLGNFLWAKKDNGTSSNFTYPYGICVSSLNEILISGASANNFSFGTQTITLSQGGAAAFILRLNSAGNSNFIISPFGSTSSSYFPDATDVCIDSQGNIYSAGGFNSTTLQFGSLPQLTNPNYLYVAYLTKLGPCSVPLAPTNITPSSNLQICAGKNSVLSVASTASVSWYQTISGTVSVGSGTIFNSPSLQAGTYTYYAEARSCTVSGNRTAITITVFPLPNISVITSTSSLCAGESATLTASGAGTFTWSNGGTQNTIVVSPTITTTYSVVGTSVNGCESSTQLTQNVTNCLDVGFANSIAKQSLLTYPNPITGNLTIESFRETTIILYNVMGEVVLKQKILPGKTAVDLTLAPQGLYILEEQYGFNTRLIKK